MTAPRTAHIFLDANTALHFQRPDLIDWCALTGCTHVVLVGAPILHRELEQQKIHNPSGKLRKRTAAYIKWLVEFVRDPAREVRARTTWHFIPVEPQIDFAAHSLAAGIGDDNLIASVISYQPTAGAEVYVATADIGMEIKLRHRRITPLLLPDTAKLPDEPDAQEKELQDLRRKIAQKHLPKLSLITELDGGRHPFKLGHRAATASAISPDEMRRKYPVLHGPEVLTTDEKAALPSDIRYQLLCADMCGISESVEKYNKEREKFFARYHEYFSKLLQWEESVALSVEMELTLSNEGTAPATDIDIILHFPEDIIVFEADNFPERPEEPEPPRRGDTLMQFSAFSGHGPSELLQPSFAELLPDVNLNDSASANQEQREVSYWSRNLKHGFTEELDPVYFRFPNRQAVRQFSVEYEISSAELPEPVTGTIHFVRT